MFWGVWLLCFAKLYIFTPSICVHSGTTVLLVCTEVSKRFGGLQALKNVNFTVNDGEIAGLVGPNGSGKSTLLNLISGVYKPDSGTIQLLGEDIAGSRRIESAQKASPKPPKPSNPSLR